MLQDMLKRTCGSTTSLAWTQGKDQPSHRMQSRTSYVSITHAVSHSMRNQPHHTATSEQPDHDRMRLS